MYTKALLSILSLTVAIPAIIVNAAEDAPKRARIEAEAVGANAAEGAPKRARINAEAIDVNDTKSESERARIEAEETVQNAWLQKAEELAKPGIEREAIHAAWLSMAEKYGKAKVIREVYMLASLQEQIIDLYKEGAALTEQSEAIKQKIAYETETLKAIKAEAAEIEVNVIAPEDVKDTLRALLDLRIQTSWDNICRAKKQLYALDDEYGITCQEMMKSQNRVSDLRRLIISRDPKAN